MAQIETDKKVLSFHRLRIFNSDPLKTKSSKSVKNSFKRTLISNQIIRKGKKYIERECIII